MGVSDWILVDQDRIDRFAKATDDYQWIHVDPQRAAQELDTGATIAHGYLTLSLIPGATEEFVRMPTLKRAINWGLNKVRFSNMVVCPSRVRVRTTVLQARGAPPGRHTDDLPAPGRDRGTDGSRALHRRDPRPLHDLSALARGLSGQALPGDA